MAERQRILLSSIGIMVVVSVSAASIALHKLYKAACETHRARLEEVVQSRARLIAAVGRFDAQFSQSAVPGGASVATLAQVVEAHEDFRGFGETGEFTLARREGDKIVWLLRHRHSDVEPPKPTSFSCGMAEPMQRALLGESGTLTGLDYRGEVVVAAYEFIPELEWGVVAKIDKREINQPFVRAGLLVSGIALLVIAVGAGFILRVTSPLIRRLETRTDELRETHEHLRAAAFKATRAEERERRKLAVDLHDGIGQILALASMKLGMLRRDAEVHEFDPQVREVEKLLTEANERSRSLTFQLCPPVLYDMGLLEATQWLIEDMQHRYGMLVTLDQDGELSPLDEVTRVSLFRCLRELLINAAKYAGTSSANVRLCEVERSILVVVEDTGVGLPTGAESRGYGFFSVRERMNHLGGTMQVESALGQGTRITLIAPISDGEPDESQEPFGEKRRVTQGDIVSK
jgi:signal transduction histidine kinase